MRNSTLLTLLCAVAAGLSGCVSAEVQFDEIEVARQNVEFPGVPGDLFDSLPEEVSDDAGVMHLPTPTESYAVPPQQFSYTNVPLELPSGVAASLTLQRVMIKPHDRNQSLAFLREAKLTMACDNSAPRTVFEYSGPGGSGCTMEDLVMPIVGPPLTLDPWNMQSCRFELSVSGRLDELPREPWSVDVHLFLSGNVEYSP